MTDFKNGKSPQLNSAPWKFQRPFMRRTHEGAYRGPLNCPFCNAGLGKISRWKFIEKVTVSMVRYECKDCGRRIKYDFSNNSNFITSKPWERQGIPSWLDMLRLKHKKKKEIEPV